MSLIKTKKLLLKITVVLTFTVLTQSSESQTMYNGPESFVWQPRGYITHFATNAPIIDGNISDAVWQQADWSDNFIDIEGASKPEPRLKTKVKMLWNDSCLFIAAALEESHLWASIQKHDAIVYQDNDFEVFLDPDNNAHDYFEIEVNAFNTIFDLFLTKPYRNGGKALIPFEIVSLQSVVKVQGTLNDPTDKDSGWTVEMAIPFRSVTFGNYGKVPEEETTWRINFSRVQWDLDIVNNSYIKRKNSLGKDLPEHNWVWSPQGIINMHFPERWGYLQFTRDPQKNKVFTLPYTEKQKQYLWSVYYRQKEYFARNGKYAMSLKDLGWDTPALEVDGIKNKIMVEASGHQFAAFIGDEHHNWSINNEGYVNQIKQIQ
ncbi:carbohydrate-binding family 9-like protein [Chitinophagaceae bacterium LB-8]|uniref:Carbohydrate-binding family 9-like protein n=1 Tax=Paraflavisolibacter caeni TaxID=2982496 RepID=A0A9X2XTY0_9BACT|nr:carbohydrate-binding family 9-like protein [Paraflavisolibacter caeni]MCU7548790.1 carbohydrate-binding family 9-like protein [Paraflavisolibacter caeni]